MALKCCSETRLTKLKLTETLFICIFQRSPRHQLRSDTEPLIQHFRRSSSKLFIPLLGSSCDSADVLEDISQQEAATRLGWQCDAALYVK